MLRSVMIAAVVQPSQIPAIHGGSYHRPKRCTRPNLRWYYKHSFVAFLERNMSFCYIQTPSVSLVGHGKLIQVPLP